MFVTVSFTTDCLFFFPPSCPRRVCFSPRLCFPLTLNSPLMSAPDWSFEILAVYLQSPKLSGYMICFTSRMNPPGAALLCANNKCKKLKIHSQARTPPASGALDTCFFRFLLGRKKRTISCPGIWPGEQPARQPEECDIVV